MVTAEQLEALDMLQLYRSGASAAQACSCDESSITRRVQVVLKTFGLGLVRNQELVLAGDRTLLDLQRLVFQSARWRGLRPLRLDASHLIRGLLHEVLPEVWQLGPCDHRGVDVALGHLQARLLDAWICSSPEDLALIGDQFRAIPLWDWPLKLAVHACHPLASVPHPSPEMLSRYPSLEVPVSHYPAFAAQLAGRGLGRGTRMRRFDRGPWDRAAEDTVTMVYGNCLSLTGHPNLVPLAFELGLVAGEVLVVLEEWLDHPRLQVLLESLHSLQGRIQKAHPELIGRL